MIPIKSNRLTSVATAHADAVQQYFENKRALNLVKINNWLIKFLGSGYTFRRVLLAKPTELESIIRNSNRPARKFPAFIVELKKIYEDFATDSKTRFRQPGKMKYSAYDLVEAIGVSVCPYCNRNFIYNVPFTKRRSSQLDHFFDKDHYPFFALSFYNLIPSCTTCNHLKSNTLGEYHNPYKVIRTIADKIHFEIKVTGSDYLDQTASLQLTVNCSSSLKTNVKVFKIEEIYQKHMDIVQEILKKKVVYNSSYIDQLMRDYGGRIFKNREQVINFALSNFTSEDELHKRPFSKLTKDVWDQI